MISDKNSETKQARERKRNCKLALRESLKYLAAKQREALDADKRARIRENRLLRWEQKIAQLENEARQARDHANSIAHAVELVRTQVGHKLIALRNASEALRKVSRTKVSRKLRTQHS